MLKKTLESHLDCKEFQQVHPKGDQSWVFIGRTDVEAETPILWPLMGRADSLEKTLMLEGIGAGGEEDVKLTFSSPVATAEFSKFADILSVAL